MKLIKLNDKKDYAVRLIAVIAIPLICETVIQYMYDRLPKFFIKRDKNTFQIIDVFEKTQYRSYVNISDDGIAQQKNACSAKELKRAGYHPCNHISDKDYERISNR